ncbi:MAG TPA: NAD(P)-dependent oxidoreductase [Trebonia sp.]|nr:NAD(P)-dependent oxidoreductase [Trebonia sp.]
MSGNTAGRSVGFVGLGNMGGRMTRRLVAAGFHVTGYDLRPGQAESVGASSAVSLGDVCDGTSAVLLSLPDSRAVEAVVLGSRPSADGLIEFARPDQVLIDLSTSAPSSTRRLYDLLAARGIGYLDAGISGGAAAADKGTLTIMAGGSAAVLDSVRWVFEPIAAKVVLMGGSGAGHSTKLLNNFLNAVTLAATAEVMVAARAAGLDLAAVLDVINSSSGVSFASLNRFPHIIRGDYLEGGLTSNLMTKDVVAYVDHVRELGVPCLNAAGPLASFGAAANLGYGEQISNRVVDAIGDLAGGIRLFDADGTSEIGDTS